MKIRKEKITFFEKHLADFFHKTGRVELPWRKSHITAYEVWVSEIMLQQTQVVRVIAYYQRFLKRFPTVESLAEATWEEFLPYYEGLGYYARGRNMLRTAQTVVTNHGGKFPRDKKLLETLPGVGPYTASAIMSFAYGENHLAWDTNLKRVIGRFFFGTKQAFSGSRIQYGMTKEEDIFFEKAFVMPKKEMNAALMDFGSALCVARPKCEACMLRSRCVYNKEQGKQEVVRSKQKEVGNEIPGDMKEARVMVFLHERHQKYFSAEKKRYAPFVLPKGYTTRADIKAYFQKRYNLTLAVRPPHRTVSVKGVPTLLVHAQILLGDPAFAIFPKSAVAEYTRVQGLAVRG